MLLVGLGFRELSMAPVFLPRVKLMIRNFSIEEAQEIAKKAMTMSSANEIRELLKEKSRAVWSEFLGETSM
jgi:phosphoenolpyruvate-protein kinase (PTS system EI component)